MVEFIFMLCSFDLYRRYRSQGAACIGKRYVKTVLACWLAGVLIGCVVGFSMPYWGIILGSILAYGGGILIFLVGYGQYLRLIRRQ